MSVAFGSQLLGDPVWHFESKLLVDCTSPPTSYLEYLERQFRRGDATAAGGQTQKLVDELLTSCNDTFKTSTSTVD